jgi:dTDP-4-dehydrorhamnose reductase
MIDCVICRYSWSFEPHRDPFLVKMMQMEVTKEEIIRSGRHCIVEGI